MKVPAGEVFGIDWTDKDAVCALARKMGKGMTVYKRANSKTYSICHTERIKLWAGHDVAMHTSQAGATKGTRHWMGSPVTECDVCHDEITVMFIDGKMMQGPWANMCPKCHNKYGVGLGLGRGQKYVFIDDNKWVKVEG